jgi:hypothetical protein
MKKEESPEVAGYTFEEACGARNYLGAYLRQDGRGFIAFYTLSDTPADLTVSKSTFRGHYGHWCAYVMLDPSLLSFQVKRIRDLLDDFVHGGVTWEPSQLVWSFDRGDESRYCVGWDYVHAGDEQIAYRKEDIMRDLDAALKMLGEQQDDMAAESKGYRRTILPSPQECAETKFKADFAVYPYLNCRQPLVTLNAEYVGENENGWKVWAETDSGEGRRDGVGEWVHWFYAEKDKGRGKTAKVWGDFLHTVWATDADVYYDFISEFPPQVWDAYDL